MIIEGFQKLADELNSITAISDVNLALRRPARPSVLEHIAEERGITPNMSFRQLMEQSNGLQLSWRFRPRVVEEFMSETIPGGEINIPSIVETYSLPTQDKIWFEEMALQGSDGPRYLSFCKELKILENLLGSTESVFVVMSPTWFGAKASHTHPKLLYWNTTGAKYPLALSLENYFPAAIQAKGFTGWQCFYIDQAGMEADKTFCDEYLARNFEEAASHRKRFLETMPWLFPQSDFKHFEELHSRLS